MKAYGLPRNNDVENPDVADIHRYGLKSRTGRFDERGYHKSSRSKRATRRGFKRAARRENASLCNEE